MKLRTNVLALLSSLLPVAPLTIFVFSITFSIRQRAAMAHPATDPPSFPLMGLPHELILQILSHAIRLSTPEHALLAVANKHNDEAEPNSPDRCYRATQPPITRTTKFLRTEALKPFYAQNTFLTPNSLHSFTDFWNWLDCIGTSNASNIACLFVEWVSGPWEPSSLLDRTWGHFQSEMEFLVSIRMPRSMWGRNIWIRVNGQDGKVVMGGEGGTNKGCYRVSLREPLDKEKDLWISAQEFAERKCDEEENLRRDFWAWYDDV